VSLNALLRNGFICIGIILLFLVTMVREQHRQQKELCQIQSAQADLKKCEESTINSIIQKLTSKE
jgi:preprotein translocase subunit YajC